MIKRKLVMETKFLGVITDQHLSWKTHISLVSKKILENCGDYCESLLLSIIQNVADLTLLTSISLPNVL